MTQQEFTPPIFLGIDVGGTNIKAGVVDDDGRTLAQTQTPTEADRGPDHGVANIFRVGMEAIEQSPVSIDEISAVGLATPGTMDIPAGLLLDPPNLPGWTNFPIRDRVQEKFQKPTVLQNDANAAAYGEYWAGAGRAVHSLVMWTLGTGIGCGIIIGDLIVEGEHSHGGECGHIIIEMDNGRRCDTGQYGTLEAYASAKSLIRRCREALESGRESLLRLYLDRGEELTPLLIARAAERGDQLADELIMEVARCLGVGTTTLMHTIDPNMVLFGGAMTFGRNETELGRRFIQRIRDEVKVRAFPVPAEKTRIDYATLGNQAGYIGAAGCARLHFGRQES
ncbi:MAG TPA: ROK family protein [Planctomycetaceae bacterium]|nr:ROK family protein [Planctomycetaceae bacterium]